LVKPHHVKFHYAYGNKIRRYTPDFAIDFRDGTSLIIEVKPARSLAKPEVRAKLQAISESMARQNHQFIVMSSETIRQQSRLDNLKNLHRRLLHPLPPMLIQQLLQLRRQHVQSTQLPFAQLTQHLGGAENVLALVSHGYLGADLSLALTAHTIIMLTPQEADYVFINSLQ
jgi:hypothetical protein